MSVRRRAPSATDDAVARLRADLERAAIAERARARAAPTGTNPPSSSAPRVDPAEFNTVFNEVSDAVDEVARAIVAGLNNPNANQPLCATLDAWCAVNKDWCRDPRLWRQAAIQAFGIGGRLPTPPNRLTATTQEMEDFFAAVPPEFAAQGLGEWRVVFKDLCGAIDRLSKYDRINWATMASWTQPRLDAELSYLMEENYEPDDVALRVQEMLRPQRLLRAWLLFQGADVERYLVSDEYTPSREMFRLVRERRYVAAMRMIDEEGAHIDFLYAKKGQEDNFNIGTLWTIMARENGSVTNLESRARGEMWRRLTANKALMNYVTPDGYTALSYACRNNMQDNLALYIIRNGGAEQVNLLNDEGKTPVWYAVKIGWVSVVEALVQFGADVNAYADTLMSPVFHAVWHSNRYMLQFLLEHGGDKQIHKPWNISAVGEPEEILPIAYAVEHGDEYIVSQLIKYGANRTPEGRAATSSGRTLLHTALASVNYGVASALLAAGGQNVDLQFNRDALNGVLQNGKSALFWAVKYGNLRLADLIVQYGGTQMINVIEEHPYPLIQQAILDRFRRMVTLLLHHGANVDQQDTATSKTAIDLAAEWGDAEVFRAVAARTQQQPLDVTHILHDALAAEASVEFIEAILTPANHHVAVPSLRTYIRQAEDDLNYNMRDVFDQQAASRESQILDALLTKLG